MITNLFRRFTGKSKAKGRAKPRQLGAYGSQSPPSNGYGGPTLPTYGGSRAPAPVQNIAPAVYGPQLPTGGSAPAGNNYAAAAPTSSGSGDSYGSPSAPPVGNGGGNVDSYGSPSAPPINGGGNQDSYGSPSAPPVNGGGNQDSYGSPSAPAIGGSVPTYGASGSGNTPNIVPAPVPVPAPSPAGDSYGSPSAAPIAPAPQPNCQVTRSLTDTGNCQQGGQV